MFFKNFKNAHPMSNKRLSGSLKLKSFLANFEKDFKYLYKTTNEWCHQLWY